jgi:hypothetical protein
MHAPFPFFGLGVNFMEKVSKNTHLIHVVLRRLRESWPFRHIEKKG